MKQKIILGTVQFGLNYGISNTAGKPSDNEVFEMLDYAFENGIECLDTADAYGDAIQKIGKYHSLRDHRFKILSKFKGIRPGDTKGQAIKSLQTLLIDFFEVYSFHSYNDYVENPTIAEELYALKQSGIIRKVGISVYTNTELEEVINTKIVDVIQIPFNILDNSNVRGELLKEAELKGKEIHIRSVFLQGLFFLNELPEKLKPLKNYIVKLKQYCEQANISMHELALNYALFNKRITRVLIGVDNKAQLYANIDAIKEHKDAFDFIDENIKVFETELLNPVNWK